MLRGGAVHARPISEGSARKREARLVKEQRRRTRRAAGLLLGGEAIATEASRGPSGRARAREGVRVLSRDRGRPRARGAAVLLGGGAVVGAALGGENEKSVPRGGFAGGRFAGRQHGAVRCGAVGWRLPARQAVRGDQLEGLLVAEEPSACYQVTTASRAKMAKRECRAGFLRHLLW